jgi:hypothetical protein
MNQVLPKISIVTPSFNQGAFSEDALLNVKQQNFPATGVGVAAGSCRRDAQRF